MKTKHTKGNWIAVDGQVELEDDTRPDICTCDPYELGQHRLKNQPPYSEVCANAQLIAAAPEMLKALESALLMLDRDGYGEPFEVGECPVCDRIRLVIAMAGGEQ